MWCALLVKCWLLCVMYYMRVWHCFTSLGYYNWSSSWLHVVYYCGLFVCICVAWVVLWIVVRCGRSCVL